MKSLWIFFAKPRNLALLLLLGGAVAFVWKDVVRPIIMPEPTKPLAAPLKAESPPINVQNATATKGGTAVISNGDGPVTIVKDAVDE
jgi:hypothetical protein